MEKIDIRDLSIGDWVQDKNGKYAQILGIEDWSDGYVLNVRINGVDVGCVPASSAHPIPITQEILEKNGVKKNGEYNEWNIGELNERPFIGVSLDRQSIRVKYFGTDIFIESKVVSAHQLQHALRLAGVGKEIEL
jgi:hypothetical protein